MIISGFITIASLHFLAVIIPGPDFAIIVHNAIYQSRQQAVWTAFGIAVGILFHLTYCITGLAFIISQSDLAFKIIKYIGAFYLIYIGIKSFSVNTVNTNIVISNKSQRHSHWDGFRDGVLCNILNPKATLFFLSLFTLVVNSNTPIWLQCIYGAEMFIATFVWFAFLALLITSPKFKNKLAMFQGKITKFMGVIFIIFAIKLLCTMA